MLIHSLKVMNGGKMELLQLKYFYAVAVNQHISNTAKQLNIAQPSLTQTIHRLENELGVKLFKSAGRNIVLTEYGRYLMNKIKPVIETIDEIPFELAEMAKLNKNTISINVMAASTIIIDALIKYQEENKDVKFQINQSTTSEMADITVFTQPFYQKQNEYTYVFSEEIYLAVPKTSAYAEMDSVALETMKDKGFISLAGSRQLRQICDRFCMHAGFSPKIIFESDSPAAVRNMIGANLGVGFWPQFSWGKINKSTVTFVPISSPVCRRDIIVTRGNDESKSNYNEVCSFFNYLIKYFEGLKEDNKA